MWSIIGNLGTCAPRVSKTRFRNGVRLWTTRRASIQLDGSQSTSSDGKPLTYVWSFPQGYPAAAISHGNSATPIVTFSMRGTYRFELTVIDSTGATSTDDIVVHYLSN